MKIECDKCSAKYSIADDKVRGKTFKIRCKKCSNVIIVRDKGVVADGGAAAAADQGAAGWHLAINGETVGPMAEDEVRQRFAAGEIDKETAVWQEGFDDWLPLGDVPAFADLERGDDPFAASANQDDYAAGGRAGMAAAGVGMAAAAAASVAATGTDDGEPQSPRVSKLTGQRNENSVLFSLDSLQAMATSGAATSAKAAAPAVARAASNPSKGLATSAPSSEGSGLIDIRALGSMVGGAGPVGVAAAAPQAAVDDAALPSFGGGGFGGLTASPLISPPTPEPAAVVAVAPPQRSNAPLYIMMVILILAVGGLAAFIILNKEEPKTIVQEVPVAAPSVGDDKDKDKDDDGDKDKDKDDEGDKDKDKDDDGDKAAAAEAGEGATDGESEGGTGGDDGVAGSGKTGTKKRSGSTGTRKPSSGTADASDPLPTTKPTSKPKSDDAPSVDCILDPSKCGSAPKKPSGDSGTASGGSTKPGAPDKLSTNDIKDGIASVKDEAKACGAKNGAKPGDKVEVKLSVSGATGKVTKATPEGEHAKTALGSCVASALKKATFKEFKNSTMGFKYSVRM